MYLVDSVVEYATQKLKEIEGKDLKSNTKDGFDIDDEDFKTRSDPIMKSTARQEGDAPTP